MGEQLLHGESPEVTEFLALYGRKQTRLGYQAQLRRWLEWCAASGVDPVSASAEDSQAFMDWLVFAGCARESSVRRAVMVVSLWVRWVRERRGGVEPTPLAVARRRGTPGEASGSLRFLSREELARFLRAADVMSERAGNPNPTNLAMLLGAGLRASECASVKWRHVVVEVVGGADVWVIQVQAGKSHSRSVPVPKRHVVRLEAGGHPGYSDGGYVLRKVSDGSQVNGPYVTQQCRRIAQQAELRDWQRVTPHVVRRTVGSRVADGASVDAAQAFLGHADRSTTLRHYVEPADAQRLMAEAAEAAYAWDDSSEGDGWLEWAVPNRERTQEANRRWVPPEKRLNSVR